MYGPEVMGLAKERGTFGPELFSSGSIKIHFGDGGECDRLALERNAVMMQDGFPFLGEGIPLYACVPRLDLSKCICQ